MTYIEWLKSLQVDDLREVKAVDAWKAGALAMLQALIDLGVIAYACDELARMDTKHIWTVDEDELKLYMAKQGLREV